MEQATSGRDGLDFSNMDKYISQLVIESSNKINREFEQRLRAQQICVIKPRIPRTNKVFLANTLRNTGRYNELLSYKTSGDTSKCNRGNGAGSSHSLVGSPPQMQNAEVKSQSRHHHHSRRHKCQKCTHKHRRGRCKRDKKSSHHLKKHSEPLPTSVDDDG